MNNLIFKNNISEPEKRGSNSKPKKLDFKKFKNNTFNSLNEVEYFLNNFKKFSDYIKLYKILK